eukprot:CAMPEP_0177647450 /NCGR_PEP_ID=MMETSP0447-20121125/10305_1 /TAXON_ID=0 /ORGANISM="Stygamoeba regulata, Strain BSH-02190019" /LENGTH=190 /DNA_ID=CAMNT_0019150033 /DNA_START=56 /DNA_END=628 /DNA_ORIENTATION=+
MKFSIKFKLDLQVVYVVVLMVLVVSIFAVSVAYSIALIIQEGSAVSFSLETWTFVCGGVYFAIALHAVIAYTVIFARGRDSSCQECCEKCCAPCACCEWCGDTSPRVRVLGAGLVAVLFIATCVPSLILVVIIWAKGSPPHLLGYLVSLTILSIAWLVLTVPAVASLYLQRIRSSSYPCITPEQETPLAG